MLSRWLDNFTIRIIIFWGFIAVIVVLNVARLFFSATAARMMGVQEYGQIAVVWAYLQLLIPVLLPVILMVILIRLRASEIGMVEK
jgi:uncharacterized membrane protein